MHKNDVVEFFGNQAKVATALGISRQSVHRWGDLIPEKQALKLVLLTKNGLKYQPELYQ